LFWLQELFGHFIFIQAEDTIVVFRRMDQIFNLACKLAGFSKFSLTLSD
jgi:hypothetical protein